MPDCPFALWDDAGTLEMRDYPDQAMRRTVLFALAFQTLSSRRRPTDQGSKVYRPTLDNSLMQDDLDRTATVPDHPRTEQTRAVSPLDVHSVEPVMIGQGTPFISVAAIESYYPHSHNAVPKLHSFVSVPVSGNIDNRLPDARSFHRVGTSPRGLEQWRRRFGDHSRMLGKAEATDRQSLLLRLFPFWALRPRAPHRRKCWPGGDWEGAAADEIC